MTKWMWFVSGYFGKTNHVGKQGDKSDDTRAMYIKCLNWSFRALAKGKWPDKDWQGKRWPKDSNEDKLKGHPLAGGYMVQIWILRADHDHKCNWMGVPGHSSAANPCPSCPCDCSDGPRGWAAVPPHAASKPFKDMQEWYKWCQEMVVNGVKGKPPILWFMPWDEGGLGLVIMMLFQDPLHALDLGIASNINANVLMYMVESDMIDGPSRTTTQMDVKLDNIWREVQGVYKEDNVKNQVGNLTLNMIVPEAKVGTEYPCLSSHIKGAQTRSLTHALLKVFERHGRVDPGNANYSEHDHEVFVVLKHLAMLYEIIMKNMLTGQWRYSAQDLKDMTDAIQKGAIMYRRLAHKSMAGDGPAWMQRSGPRWTITSKHHHVLHMCEEARLQCLHMAWCYMNEGFVGMQQKVGESCRHGSQAHRRSHAIVDKWSTGTVLMLHHLELGIWHKPVL